MDRRLFLKSAAGILCSAGVVPLAGWSPRALSAPGSPMPRTLVHTMLEGGADFRYVFAPHPSSDPLYVEQYWNARSSIYRTNYADYAEMFAGEYIDVTSPGTSIHLGIHKTCGWLAQQFEAGNVAVVANVYASLNRKHDHSQLIVYAGDVETEHLDVARDGWGGRLVESISPETRVVAFSRAVSMFCYGTDENDRLNNVYHSLDLRNEALPKIDTTLDVSAQRNVLTRSLNAYYRAREVEVQSGKPANWPYRRLFSHHQSLRVFGRSIDDRLQTIVMPSMLMDLDINSSEFEQQCRNLYDSYFVNDILNSRVISLHYTGWDNHAYMSTYINPRLSDVFGSSGGLATVNAELAAGYQEAADNTVFAFSSDFGRQLAANGVRGTDHGRGTYSILIGEQVAGGVYGELFPQSEAAPLISDAANRTPFEIPGSDITGLTAYERVMAAACDWVEPGSASSVFPQVASTDLESGVNLDLFI